MAKDICYMAIYRMGHPENDETKYYLTIDRKLEEGEMFNDISLIVNVLTFVEKADKVDKLVLEYQGKQSGLIYQLRKIFDE